MTIVFIISYVLLWIIVVAQGVAIYVIAKHLGEQLVFSQHAVDRQGLKPGSRLPASAARIMLSDGDPNRLQCFVFVAPKCAGCHSLLKGLGAMRAEFEERIDFIAISRGGGTENTWAPYRHILTRLSVDDEWVAGSALRIVATPFVLFVVAGVVVAKGRPTTQSQFRELANDAFAYVAGVGERTPALSA